MLRSFAGRVEWRKYTRRRCEAMVNRGILSQALSTGVTLVPMEDAMTDARDMPEHVQRNQRFWAEWSKDFARWAPKMWASETIRWGQYQVPDAELGAL